MASRRLPGLSPGVWAMALVERIATSASKRKSSTPRRDKKPELTGANMSPDLIPAQGRVQAPAGEPFRENCGQFMAAGRTAGFSGPTGRRPQAERAQGVFPLLAKQDCGTPGI